MGKDQTRLAEIPHFTKSIAFSLEQRGQGNLVIRGRLPNCSYVSHDYVAGQQVEKSIHAGSFVATIFLTPVTSAHTYRYDNLIDENGYAGAIARVEFIAYDAEGKVLLTDLFVVGRAECDDCFMSHNEIWHANAGVNSQSYLHSFVSDCFSELGSSEADALLWEGKSLKFYWKQQQDFVAPELVQALSDCQSQRPEEESVEESELGYFAYSHDFNGEMSEYHWALTAAITDIRVSQ